MNTYRKLQSKVYSIIYKDGVPLEFGVEVTVADENLVLYNPDTIRIVTYGVNPLGEVQVDGGKDYIKKESLGKILGKPLDLQSILRAIYEKRSKHLWNWEVGAIWRDCFASITYITNIDLSKPIQEQDEEVLSKLLELLS